MRKSTIILFMSLSTALWAQDSISLIDCHNLALENAPRLNDRELIRQIGELKVDNVASSWYPSLQLNGRVSYQSDVVTIALTESPVPVAFPEVPHDQYGLNIDISQTIYDGGIARQRQRFEEASYAVDIQQVEVDLQPLKAKVNQCYFAILLLQENRNNLEIHMDNLVKRKEVMKSAIDNGALLEADLKVLEVEILRVRQSLLEIDSRRRSFLGVLEVLCNREFSDGLNLETPDLYQFQTEEGRRPEYNLFDLKQASMEEGKELLGKKRMPVLYAFGQTGYGKPGYNMLSGEWDFYYMVGAGLRWNIWDWNNNNRERQIIDQQQLILENKRNTFNRELATQLIQEESRMEQYKKAMELEEQVLELQKEVSENAAAKLAGGTITVTDYITELNKESVARIQLAAHQVQLAQSLANYLTIQGIL